MKIYALALYAEKPNYASIEIAYISAAIVADNDYEVIGRGIELAKKNWPVSDGWERHNAVHCLVPDSFIKQVTK